MTQTQRPRTAVTALFSCRIQKLALIVCGIMLISYGGRGSASAQTDAAAHRAAAHAQFLRAETLRMALDEKPVRSRSLTDYRDLIAAYRKVYILTPHAAEVPDALNHVAELYRDMGQQFQREYYGSAIEAFELLVHEYPNSRYRETAVLAIADVQRNGLGLASAAQKTYEDFLEQHPGSPNAAKARDALSEMKTASASGKPVKKAKGTTPPATETVNAGKPAASADDASPREASDSGTLAEVSHIRAWNADTYTRVIIQVGEDAKYQTARIANPDRIYFDVESSKVSPALIRQSIEVPANGYLKSIRVAQRRPNVVRIVMEVTHVKDYSVFQLPKPGRLVVDVYGPDASIRTASNAPEPVSAPAAEAKPEKDASTERFERFPQECRHFA